MNEPNDARSSAFAPRIFMSLLASLGGLAFGRILFELLFPTWLWLGRPVVAAAMALAAGAIAWWLHGRHDSQGKWTGVATLLPLSLNLIYLFEPEVDLVRSRLVLAASIWLSAVLSIRSFGHRRPRWWQGIGLLVAALLPIYLMTMPDTVGRADTFEFQVVAPKLGIAHPTGYPLYLMLGKLFTLLPLGSVAWRLNLGSALFALGCASLLYLVCRRLVNGPRLAILSAVMLGSRPTFWSQAIEAEVYTLHALITALALWLMVMLLATEEPGQRRRLAIALSLAIGLGLSNHLTSAFLLPPAALAILLAQGRKDWPATFRPRFLFPAGLALAIPLLLYLYLPLRWAAVNGEPMGVSRFLEWVLGSRFSGALQWGAWLAEPARYQILGRIFVENWGIANLLLVLAGFVLLFRANWRYASVLLATWLGFLFYALNYYVPDVSVFLLPAHLVMAIAWSMGIKAILDLLRWALRNIPGLQADQNTSALLISLLVSVFMLPTLMQAIHDWTAVDRSHADSLTEWGSGVLSMPLANNATILADSEKIAPLLYLQQSEGIRPDLDIMVLPDEAAYRWELDTRVANGQTVYLARFLPGLEGVYYLRSVGPLTEVSTAPMDSLPDSTSPAGVNFGSIRLVGYELQTVSPVERDSSGVTLYWQRSDPVYQPLMVFVRWWDGLPGSTSQAVVGQHPVNNYYPSNAWKGEEIVADFHLLPRPIGTMPTRMQLQVALAPAFTAPSLLGWREIASVEVPRLREMRLDRAVRSQIGSMLVTGAQFPISVRPEADIPLVLAGFGEPESLQLKLLPIGEATHDVQLKEPAVLTGTPEPFLYQTQLSSAQVNERYQLTAFSEGGGAICGWLKAATHGCPLGEIEVKGVPLPEGASNFDDKIALRSMEISATTLEPGGRLEVDLRWQALGPIDEDYTIFIQVLDNQDNIVGQVDAWPLQGTYPTSQWPAGEVIVDTHVVQLKSDLAPGNYHLQVGWYLLATLHRLPILNSDGNPIEEKVVLTGLVAPGSGE